MSEPAQLAKSARELLAAALNALQSNGGVSPEIEALAEPIAQAMGIMHRIERSGGQALDGSEIALGHVRDVLNRLQRITAADPVVDVLMEHVASSLSKVNALSRAQAAGASAQARAPVAAAAPAPVAPAPVVAVAAPAPFAPVPVAAPPAPAPAAVAAPAPFAPAPAPAAMAAPAPFAPAPAPAAMAAPAPFAPAPAPAAMAAPAPFAPAPAAVAAPAQVAPVPAVAVSAPLQHTLPSPQQPRRAPAPASPAYAAASHPAADPRGAPPPQAMPQPVDHRAHAAVVDVELGALTPSNFYKGLAGNDVIEHGGIFVATYKIPPTGSVVTLRVRLPGNYEFTAQAAVRWTREAGGSRDSAEPGFGARITQISAEGRQLVSRFTRNREPLFYDDL
ncbi:hypothetical protein WMF27_39870 [Sorangium sp. So ce281]|uniref:hypothetical protein n=1 Tax=unclassified Sorangium TaxID=2621164 RepID=UPI003F5E5C75